MKRKDRSRHRVAECQKDESDDHLPATLRPAESLPLLLLLPAAALHRLSQLDRISLIGGHQFLTLRSRHKHM